MKYQIYHLQTWEEVNSKIMSSEEVLEKVKGIIVEQLGVSESAVTMEASFIFVAMNFNASSLVLECLAFIPIPWLCVSHKIV